MTKLNDSDFSHEFKGVDLSNARSQTVSTKREKFNVSEFVIAITSVSEEHQKQLDKIWKVAYRLGVSLILQGACIIYLLWKVSHAV